MQGVPTLNPDIGKENVGLTPIKESENQIMKPQKTPQSILKNVRSALINGGDDGEKKKKRKSMGRRVSFAPDNELTTHFFFEKSPSRKAPKISMSPDVKSFGLVIEPQMDGPAGPRGDPFIPLSPDGSVPMDVTMGLTGRGHMGGNPHDDVTRSVPSFHNLAEEDEMWMDGQGQGQAAALGVWGQATTALRAAGQSYGDVTRSLPSLSALAEGDEAGQEDAGPYGHLQGQGQQYRLGDVTAALPSLARLAEMDEEPGPAAHGFVVYSRDPRRGSDVGLGGGLPSLVDLLDIDEGQVMASPSFPLDRGDITLAVPSLATLAAGDEDQDGSAPPSAAEEDQEEEGRVAGVAPGRMSLGEVEMGVEEDAEAEAPTGAEAGAPEAQEAALPPMSPLPSPAPLAGLEAATPAPTPAPAASPSIDLGAGLPSGGAAAAAASPEFSFGAAFAQPEDPPASHGWPSAARSVSATPAGPTPSIQLGEAVRTPPYSAEGASPLPAAMGPLDGAGGISPLPSAGAVAAAAAAARGSASVDRSPGMVSLPDTGALEEGAEGAEGGPSWSHEMTKMQRSKWGFVPGGDDTLSFDVRGAGRAMMGDVTFHQVYGATGFLPTSHGATGVIPEGEEGGAAAGPGGEQPGQEEEAVAGGGSEPGPSGFSFPSSAPSPLPEGTPGAQEETAVLPKRPWHLGKSPKPTTLGANRGPQPFQVTVYTYEPTPSPSPAPGAAPAPATARALAAGATPARLPRTVSPGGSEGGLPAGLAALSPYLGRSQPSEGIEADDLIPEGDDSDELPRSPTPTPSPNGRPRPRSVGPGPSTGGRRLTLSLLDDDVDLSREAAVAEAGDAGAGEAVAAAELAQGDQEPAELAPPPLDAEMEAEPEPEAEAQPAAVEEAVDLDPSSGAFASQFEIVEERDAAREAEPAKPAGFSFPTAAPHVGDAEFAPSPELLARGSPGGDDGGMEVDGQDEEEEEPPRRMDGDAFPAPPLSEPSGTPAAAPSPPLDFGGAADADAPEAGLGLFGGSPADLSEFLTPPPSAGAPPPGLVAAPRTAVAAASLAPASLNLATGRTDHVEEGMTGRLLDGETAGTGAGGAAMDVDVAGPPAAAEPAPAEPQGTPAPAGAPPPPAFAMAPPAAPTPHTASLVGLPDGNQTGPGTAALLPAMFPTPTGAAAAAAAVTANNGAALAAFTRGLQNLSPTALVNQVLGRRAGGDSVLKTKPGSAVAPASARKAWGGAYGTGGRGLVAPSPGGMFLAGRDPAAHTPSARLYQQPVAVPLTFQDFVKEAELQFLDQLRRGTSIGVGDLAIDPPPATLRDAYRLLCITAADVHALEGGIRTLQDEISARRIRIGEKEAELAERNPEVFRRIQLASGHELEELRGRIQLLKKVCRSQTVLAWKEWRATVERRLEEELAERARILKEDLGFLEGCLEGLREVHRGATAMSAAVRGSIQARAEARRAHRERMAAVRSLEERLEAEGRANEARGKERQEEAARLGMLEARRDSLATRKAELQARVAEARRRAAAESAAGRQGAAGPAPREAPACAEAARALRCLEVGRTLQGMSLDTIRQQDGAVSEVSLRFGPQFRMSLSAAPRSDTVDRVVVHVGPGPLQDLAATMLRHMVRAEAARLPLSDLSDGVCQVSVSRQQQPGRGGLPRFGFGAEACEALEPCASLQGPAAHLTCPVLVQRLAPLVHLVADALAELEACREAAPTLAAVQWEEKGEDTLELSLAFLDTTREGRVSVLVPLIGGGADAARVRVEYAKKGEEAALHRAAQAAVAAPGPRAPISEVCASIHRALAH